MKPDWRDAPEWASWLAQDDGGWWYWYEDKPYIHDGFEWVSNSKYSFAGFDETELSPADTLESRA